MRHVMIDAFKSYRSKLDDIRLVYELLEEIPAKLNIKSVMPPIVLPYYNGVIPEDCGISAFVFLAGGHFTLHTFSYRECYYVDFFCTPDFCEELLLNQLSIALPSERIVKYSIKRGIQSKYEEMGKEFPILNRDLDFGPHLFLDFDDYHGKYTMDDLFMLFDTLPFKIGMTPIIRPYISVNKIDNETIISILTMIAESHISLHLFKESHKAYFDIFSCKFFNSTEVFELLKKELQGNICGEMLVSRGSNYSNNKNVPIKQFQNSNWWFNSVYHSTKCN